jgi:hypothetical protein
MLKIPDRRFFCEVVAESVVDAHLTHRQTGLRNRWINAIAKAASVILEGDTEFIHWELQKQILYFWSPDSNEIYEIGDSSSCVCPAYSRRIPQPCYHRAMHRLVKNYFEFLKKPGELPKIDFAAAVFFDFELTVREKVNLLNLSILEGRTELETHVAALERFMSS